MTIDVIDVRVVGHHEIMLMFSDGYVGRFNLGSLDGSGPMFEPLADPEFFAQVRVDRESGTVVWPNGLDLCPDVLYAYAVLNSLVVEIGRSGTGGDHG